MQKTASTLVTTVSEFIEWAAQFNQGTYLFRGVTNEEYNINASAYRRLKDKNESSEDRVVNLFKSIVV